MSLTNASHIAFRDRQLLATGNLLAVATAVKRESASLASILVFALDSGRQLDLDLSGSDADLQQRYGEVVESADSSASAANIAAAAKPGRGRGRPKLGVVGREVTLLPRHWQWLDTQSGGASAALRRLVEQAAKENSAKDAIRQSQDSAHRFMTAIAGDLRGFEEAIRALFACDKESIKRHMASWPADIRACALHLASGIFPK
ncbi:hypothetical protein AB833_06270 [Chromatiales bacterium (ex Bugula neritina AB1)]|nr:hypothetical protein AB833_06270 [Chromatiales bacterium (ex Bugula neritina AB1)]